MDSLRFLLHHDISESYGQRRSGSEIGADANVPFHARCSMLLRHSRLIAAATALVLSLASAAGADVLWDQSNWNTNTEGSVDLSSTACNQLSGNTKVHIANDVHFDTPVHITTIRIYETFGNVQAATQALLWIRPKNSVLPTTVSDSLELASLLVNITPVTETIGPNQCVRVSATGLDIELPAGDYWAPLTPRHNLGIFPYTVHLITTGPVVGDPAAAIVACTSNSNWVYPLAPNLYDYAMKIEGEFHGPTAPLPTGARGEASTP